MARRIPLGNLIFRLLGVLLALPFLGQIGQELAAFDADPIRLIVNFHLLFNLALCLGLLAFIGPVGRLVDMLLPEPVGSAHDEGPRHLDDALLDTPPVALAMAARETLRMGDIVEEMLGKSLRVLEQDDDALRREVEASDDDIDQLHEAIKLYLTRLSRGELDDEDSRRAVDIIAFTTNLEHVGDIIDKNLMELAAKKIRGKLHFSAEGLCELKDMHARLMATVRLALTVFINQELDSAKALLARKDQLREMELSGTERHLARLRSGKVASLDTSALHLDIMRDFKRIHSHLTSVAYPILDRAGVLRPSRLRRKPKAERRPTTHRRPRPRRRSSGRAAQAARRAPRPDLEGVGGRLPVQLGDLRTLERQVAHQALLAENEGEHRIVRDHRVDVGGLALIDHGDLGVAADLPARAVAEVVERLLRHEHDDLGVGLAAQLQADRGRGGAVVAGGLVVDDQGAFAIRAADADRALGHLGEDQQALRLLGGGIAARDVGRARIARPLDAGIDLGGRLGSGRSGEDHTDPGYRHHVRKADHSH